MENIAEYEVYSLLSTIPKKFNRSIMCIFSSIGKSRGIICYMLNNQSHDYIFQGKRVQKCVEKLDQLKVSNARIKPVVVTTKWEIFDHPPSSTTWELFD